MYNTKRLPLVKVAFFYTKYKAFSLIETIISITLITIILSVSTPKKNLSKLKLAKEQIIMHLKYMRYIAMIDNKYDNKNNFWYLEAWNLKFLNCKKSIGGIYYVIYENIKNPTHWAISKDETLKDPLTNNYIYSYQCKKDELYDKSKFVLLSDYYNIKSIKLSCNNTNSLGQIIFLNNGSAYTNVKINENVNKYKIINQCLLTLIDKNNKKETIYIEGNTGYIH